MMQLLARQSAARGSVTCNKFLQKKIPAREEDRALPDPLRDQRGRACFEAMALERGSADAVEANTPWCGCQVHEHSTLSAAQGAARTEE